MATQLNRLYTPIERRQRTSIVQFNYAASNVIKLLLEAGASGTSTLSGRNTVCACLGLRLPYVSTVSGFVAKGSPDQASRFHKPPSHPVQSDFPSTVGSQ